ncbi:MAG: polyprenyl diphosphate synthase [Pseudohongiellaceae bacterium]
MTPDADNSKPRHVAIIMDGNSRWAKAHALSSRAGHRAGAEAAREIVNSCVRRGIPYLTLFAFSSENWLRPSKEVQSLMALFLAVLKRKEIDQFHRNNVRLEIIGNRASFSRKLQESMAEVEQLTADNTGTTVIVAADYGGRWDIAEAARRVAAEAVAGRLALEDINAEMVQHHICLGRYPMPDLCIRTGGENRISNFLLWQFAYTELYFTDCFWPDFDDHQFQLALNDFARRQRRFGRHSEAELSGQGRA